MQYTKILVHSARKTLKLGNPNPNNVPVKGLSVPLSWRYKAECGWGRAAFIAQALLAFPSVLYAVLLSRWLDAHLGQATPRHAKTRTETRTFPSQYRSLGIDATDPRRAVSRKGLCSCPGAHCFFFTFFHVEFMASAADCFCICAASASLSSASASEALPTRRQPSVDGL